MSNTNRAVVGRLFEELWGRHNLDICDELMASDFVEHGVAPFMESPPGRVHGPSAMRDTAEWLLSQFPDLRMTVECIVAERDTVAVRVLADGTNRGSLDGVLPATGRRFSAHQSHWFRVEDGMLAEHWATRDDLTAMLQLGVLRPPGPPRGPDPVRSD
jgi:predicted ester cyclase